MSSSSTIRTTGSCDMIPRILRGLIREFKEKESMGGDYSRIDFYRSYNCPLTITSPKPKIKIIFNEAG
jgi:hypothetical protein